ncbi:MAG TPA: hypothetical protein EYP33_07135, partial [Pyrodictium sp.]|nr:hypothetical protein [Pyrodictium sp.]
MVIDETALRAAITDALLRSAGLPTLADVKKMLSEAESKTTVSIVTDDSKYGEHGVDVVRNLLTDYDDFVEIKVLEKSSWPEDLPPPLRVIGGKLEGRL